MHLAASATTWYAARTGGIVAYLLVSACVLAGILLAGRRRLPGLPRFAVEDVHRFLGILAGVFVAVHVGAIALDTVVPFSLTQIVVPFTAVYRPLATGLGVVALELLLAVSVANRLRSRLPYRIWRRTHYATLAVWLLATAHGVLSGTDRNQTWLLSLYAVTAAAVACAAALRFGSRLAERRLGFGLAMAGGTLAAVLGLSAVPQQASSSTRTSPAVNTIPEISGDLSGTIDDSGSGIVSIRGTVVAAATSTFRIDLLANDGRVSDSAFQMLFAGGATCEGTLISLDERGFTGTCTPPGGEPRTVHADWTVSSGTVAGSISTTADSPAGVTAA